MSLIAPTLQSFFTDRLARQKNASPHTVVGQACTADQSNNAETVAGLGGVYVVVSEAGGSRARFWRGRPTGSRPRWPQRRAPCPGEAAFPPRLRRSILSPGR